MSLDKLAIIFLIIILPISLVLSTYTRTQTDTLNTQLAYDTKLNNATYDAMKAYQLNAFNESASNLGNVRIGHINAAVNTFYSSLSANLNMSGYNRAFLEDFVPAIVFTTYDGYYIYSKYTNKIGDEDYYSQAERDAAALADKKELSTRQDGELLYGLKPFVHYSCRYKKGDSDFVITYSLDNYISIHGIINNKLVDDSGYLIDIGNDGTDYDKNTREITYRGVRIEKEPILQEYLILEGEEEAKLYKYHEVNGVKYYLKPGTEASGGVWFSLLNGEPLVANFKFDLNWDDSAYNHYREAYAFTQRVTQDTGKDIYGNNCYGLNVLKVSDAYQVELDVNGNKIPKKGNEFLKQANLDGKIFDLDEIEEPGSNFNEHRLAVIRYAIEKNLSIAIKNYNKFNGSGGTPVETDFQMPEFREQEWDQIQSNMTIITYLQGLPIGTKLYNGVSVVSNNVNSEVVTDNSIYIADGRNESTGDKTYYPITRKGLEDKMNGKEPFGVLNIDLERKQIKNSSVTNYYYPKLYYSDYNQETVNLYSDVKDVSKGQYNYNGNIYKYLDDLKGTTNSGDTRYEIVKAYYTALGRERQSMYKQWNNYENMLTKLTDEELEDNVFNSKFKRGVYEGNNKTADEVNEIVNIVLAFNSQEGDLNKRIVVRQGGGPSDDEDYVSNDKKSDKITDKCVNELHYWNTDNTRNNYVVAVIGNNATNGYKGDLSADSTKHYNIKYYTYKGRIKAIYVSRPY